MVQFKEILVNLFLLLHDLFIGTFILVASIYLKKELGKYGILWIKPGVYNCFHAIWWISLFVAFMFFIRGLYHKRFPFWDEVKEITLSIFYAVLVSFAIIYLRKMEEFPRSILIFYLFFSVIFFPISRHMLKLFLFKIGLYKRRVLVLGAGNSGKAVVDSILRQRELGMIVLGFLDDFESGEVRIRNKTFSVLGTLQNLKDVLNELKIEAVIIAMPSLNSKKLSILAAEVQVMVKILYIIPETKGIALSNVQLYNLFNEQMFLLRINNNLQYLKNILLKRVFDIVLSILLLPFLVPVIIFLAILIKFDSGGPVFFSHYRIGKGGKKIKVYKFRSMYENSQKLLEEILKNNKKAREEWETNFKLRDDPRVTRIGKLLRRTSLDELPQIFNVLFGSMSFVGPRPVVEEEIRRYYKNKAKFYYMVKPGITGLWQVSGRSNIDYDYRVELDAWYVLNWSLWIDVVILLKTFRVVLKKEGAY